MQALLKYKFFFLSHALIATLAIVLLAELSFAELWECTNSKTGKSILTYSPVIDYDVDCIRPSKSSKKIKSIENNKVTIVKEKEAFKNPFARKRRYYGRYYRRKYSPYYGRRRYSTYSTYASYKEQLRKKKIEEYYRKLRLAKQKRKELSNEELEILLESDYLPYRTLECNSWKMSITGYEACRKKAKIVNSLSDREKQEMNRAIKVKRRSAPKVNNTVTIVNRGNYINNCVGNCAKSFNVGVSKHPGVKKTMKSSSSSSFR